MRVRMVDSAEVSESATTGDGSHVWHLAQVRERAVVGGQCVVGPGAQVGPAVRIGNCTLHNHALVHEPATLEDGVFVGCPDAGNTSSEDGDTLMEVRS